MSTQKAKHERPGARVNPSSLAQLVNVRIPGEDLDLIKSTAEAQGLTLSAFIRGATMGTAVAEPQVREHVLTAGAAQHEPAISPSTTEDTTG